MRLGKRAEWVSADVVSRNFQRRLAPWKLRQSHRLGPRSLTPKAPARCAAKPSAPPPDRLACSAANVDSQAIQGRTECTGAKETPRPPASSARHFLQCPPAARSKRTRSKCQTQY